jgi:hypothetical protein
MVDYWAKMEGKMKLEEIPKSQRTEYAEDCDCGKTIKVLTQRADGQEYDTKIHIQCDCGEYVEFILPVN